MIRLPYVAETETVADTEAIGRGCDLAIVIGPEGGLSTEEVEAAQEQGGIAVSLGRRILRTETAGLVAATAILYETDNLGI